MDTIKKLLELRKRIKSKKPHFIRQDTRKKKRLSKVWRRPRGLDSKIRRRMRGRPIRVSQGYRSPRMVRGLHKSGLRQIVVNSQKDIEALSPQEHGIIVSALTGDKKRVLILKIAKDRGFKVLNIKDGEEYIRKVEEKLKSKEK